MVVVENLEGFCYEFWEGKSHRKAVAFGHWLR